MLSSLQRSLFRFAGGFVLADAYANAVRPALSEASHTASDEAPSSWSWFRSSRSSTPPPQTIRRFDLDTLRGDLDDWIEANQLLALVGVCFAVMGGGGFAIAGAATSIAFDGEMGRERYLMLRDEIDNLWEGSNDN